MWRTCNYGVFSLTWSMSMTKTKENVIRIEFNSWKISLVTNMAPVTSRENTLFAAWTAMLVSSVAWATWLWRACNVTRTSKVSICQWIFLLCFGQILEYRVTPSVVVLNNNNRVINVVIVPQLRLSKLVVLALCGSEFCSCSLCLYDAFWQVTDLYYIILYYIILI